MAFKTDYKDAIAPDGGRKYSIAENSDGTVSIADATEYLQTGDRLGAKELNAMGAYLNNLCNMLYPVGAIYISAVSTSPATLFGGTWAALGGRMLIGADSTYPAGSTGGEATHTLTVNELPTISYAGAQQTALKSAAGDMYGVTVPETCTFGGDQPHNNLPPYLAVYMWKRTA